jgi:hypothetical protein
MVPMMGTMGFVRNKSRRGKDGATLNYYYLVENKWEKGEVKQKVVKYLGTSPNTRELPVDPAQAGPLAQALMSGAISTEDMKKLLKELGINISGRLRQVSLVYNPPLGKLTLRVE